MSTRALRKAQEKLEKKSAGSNESESDEEVVNPTGNRFGVFEESLKDEDLSPEAETTGIAEDTTKAKRKKKRGKQKKIVAKSAIDETIGNLTDILNDLQSNLKHGGSQEVPNPNIFGGGVTNVLKIDYRNLNPDNELKRIFGSVLGEQRSKGKKQHGRAAGASRLSAKLVQPKPNWPPAVRTGLTMTVGETLPNGQTMFTFEHGPTYQLAQNLFWSAGEFLIRFVDGMNPEMFLAILQEYPYHIDTLLQLSEVVRMNEDFQMARDLVERAIYACECAFHPLFSIPTENCRLDYSQAENRPFFIALARHLSFLMQKSCFRTALEFCKLIYNLDPDDPLGMMLLFDHLALKCGQYDFIANLFYQLEATRNLSLLPNFVFSMALGCFLKSEDLNDPELKLQADEMLQTALLKFPTWLIPCLDKCSVAPDKAVDSFPLFSVFEQNLDSPGLKQLIQVYVSRSFTFWKEPKVLLWLEENVKRSMERFNDDKAMVDQFREIRRTKYRGTPKNIIRHILMWDLQSAVVNLPQDVRDKPILSYDPLPPSDSRRNYEKPDGPRRRVTDESFFTSFLLSLLPNYNPDAPVEENLEVLEGAVGAERPQAALQESVHTLLNAVRQLLGNIQPTEVQRDGLPPADDHSDSDSDEWN